MAPYIEDSSYPLKWLKVNVYHPSIFQHAKLRSAKHLVVLGMDHNDWLPIYLNLENHKVHVMDHQVVGLMPVDDIMVFIRHWTSCGKELGASFSYRLNVYNKRERLDFHEEILKRIKKQFKNSISEHRYIFRIYFHLKYIFNFQICRNSDRQRNNSKSVSGI